MVFTGYNLDPKLSSLHAKIVSKLVSKCGDCPSKSGQWNNVANVVKSSEELFQIVFAGSYGFLNDVVEVVWLLQGICWS
jgi:hypothetical protein